MASIRRKFSRFQSSTGRLRLRSSCSRTQMHPTRAHHPRGDHTQHQQMLDCRQIVFVWLMTVVHRAVHSNSPQHCLPPALVLLPMCMFVYRTSSASRNSSLSPDIPSAQPDMENQTWSFGMLQSMSDSRRDQTMGCRRDQTTRPSGRAENLTYHRNQTEADMEIRHASILALSVKRRVG